MDLRDYLSFIPRRVIAIATITLALVLITLLYTTAYSETFYKAELMVTATIENTQITDDFKYSNYYNEFTANNFINTLEGWFIQPNLIHDAYKNAGVDMNSDLSLGGKFLGPMTVKKKNRGNLQISFKSKSKENAEKLSNATVSEVQKLIKQYNEVTKSDYRIIAKGPFISEQKPEPAKNGILALIIGFLFATVLAYVYELMTDKISHAGQASEILSTPISLILGRKASKEDLRFLKSIKLKYNRSHIINCTNKTLPHFSEQKELKLHKNYEEIAKLNSDEAIIVFIKLGKTTISDLNKLKSLTYRNPKFLIVYK